MSNVLVLGAGLIGTFAARAIADQGVTVVAADLQPAPHYFGGFGPKKNAGLATADILDSGAVSSLIKGYAADIVVLCAGLTGAACARDRQKAWEVNVQRSRRD